jgi:hypothetical protein
MVMNVEVDMEVLQAGVADSRFGDSARDDHGEVDQRLGVVLVAAGDELWDEEGDAARRIGVGDAAVVDVVLCARGVDE